MKKTIFLNLVVLLVLAVSAPAATRLVPDEYPTIQSAIDAAVHGDVVIVAPGTYTGNGNRDIDFLGKAITVRSANPNDPNIIASTIIDCNSTIIEPHRGFFFHSGENHHSVISGLTIINGRAPLFEYQAGSRTDNYWAGGAVFCYESSPTISLCRFDRNRADWFGGAVACWGSEPTITECAITNNVANNGGGFHSNYGNPILNRCIISNNIACGGDIGLGANRGGGVFSWGGTTLKNCLLFKNGAQAGGAIFVGGDNFNAGDTQILNCTISANTATWGGAVYCGELSSPAIVNSILVGDNAVYGAEIAMTRIDWGSHLSVRYSNVRGGKDGIFKAARLHWGDGNTDTDPCFISCNNDNYRLKPSSACINTGDPNYIPDPNETDLDGKPRIIGGRIDMGAYEFNHRPVADAGQDQTVYAWIDGNAPVTLDGSDSNDPDGDELTYKWIWEIDGYVYEANGVSPTIELPVGEYEIELVVNDGIDDSEPNYTTVTVIEPLTCRLQILPPVINRKSHQEHIMAWLILPAGIAKADVNELVPLSIYPGGIEAERQYILDNRRGNGPYTRIFAFFDKAELMSAVPDNGRVDLQVVGRLKTGRYFYGSDTVWIIDPPHRRPQYQKTLDADYADYRYLTVFLRPAQDKY